MNILNTIALFIGWIYILAFGALVVRLAQIVLIGIFWERAVIAVTFEWQRFCASPFVSWFNVRNKNRNRF
jgi:hypothetical protein